MWTIEIMTDAFLIEASANSYGELIERTVKGWNELLGADQQVTIKDITDRYFVRIWEDK